MTECGMILGLQCFDAAALATWRASGP